MFIPISLLVLIVVIAVSPDKTRAKIANMMGDLVAYGLTLVIIITVIVAVVAAIWFGVRWVWSTFPENHIMTGSLMVVAAISFVAGLLGIDLMD